MLRARAAVLAARRVRRVSTAAKPAELMMWDLSARHRRALEPHVLVTLDQALPQGLLTRPTWEPTPELQTARAALDMSATPRDPYLLDTVMRTTMAEAAAEEAAGAGDGSSTVVGPAALARLGDAPSTADLQRALSMPPPPTRGTATDSDAKTLAATSPAALMNSEHVHAFLEAAEGAFLGLFGKGPLPVAKALAGAGASDAADASTADLARDLLHPAYVASLETWGASAAASPVPPVEVKSVLASRIVDAHFVWDGRQSSRDLSEEEEASAEGREANVHGWPVTGTARGRTVALESLARGGFFSKLLARVGHYFELQPLRSATAQVTVAFLCEEERGGQRVGVPLDLALLKQQAAAALMEADAATVGGGSAAATAVEEGGKAASDDDASGPSGVADIVRRQQQHPATPAEAQPAGVGSSSSSDDLQQQASSGGRRARSRNSDRVRRRGDADSDAAAGTSKTINVGRGFVVEKHKMPADLASGQPGRTVTVVSLGGGPIAGEQETRGQPTPLVRSRLAGQLPVRVLELLRRRNDAAVAAGGSGAGAAASVSADSAAALPLLPLARGGGVEASDVYASVLSTVRSASTGKQDGDATSAAPGAEEAAAVAPAEAGATTSAAAPAKLLVTVHTLTFEARVDNARQWPSFHALAYLFGPKLTVGRAWRIVDVNGTFATGGPQVGDGGESSIAGAVPTFEPVLARIARQEAQSDVDAHMRASLAAEAMPGGPALHRTAAVLSPLYADMFRSLQRLYTLLDATPAGRAVLDGVTTRAAHAAQGWSLRLALQYINYSMGISHSLASEFAAAMSGQRSGDPWAQRVALERKLEALAEGGHAVAFPPSVTSDAAGLLVEPPLYLTSGSAVVAGTFVLDPRMDVNKVMSTLCMLPHIAGSFSAGDRLMLATQQRLFISHGNNRINAHLAVLEAMTGLAFPALVQCLEDVAVRLHVSASVIARRHVGSGRGEAARAAGAAADSEAADDDDSSSDEEDELEEKTGSTGNAAAGAAAATTADAAASAPADPAAASLRQQLARTVTSLSDLLEHLDDLKEDASDSRHYQLVMSAMMDAEEDDSLVPVKSKRRKHAGDDKKDEEKEGKDDAGGEKQQPEKRQSVRAMRVAFYTDVSSTVDELVGALTALNAFASPSRAATDTATPVDGAAGAMNDPAVVRITRTVSTAAPDSTISLGMESKRVRRMVAAAR